MAQPLLLLLLGLAGLALASAAAFNPPNLGCNTIPLPAGPNCNVGYHLASDGKCYQDCTSTYTFVPATKQCLAICGAYSDDLGDTCRRPQYMRTIYTSKTACDKTLRSGGSCSFCNTTVDAGWYAPCSGGLQPNLPMFCSWCLAQACPANTIMDPEDFFNCVKKSYHPSSTASGRYCPAGYQKVGMTCVSKNCNPPPKPPAPRLRHKV